MLDSYTHQGYERYARERVREATAVYFEWLAQKETPDYDRRQRLLEVAGFYRSLAGIIPAMPTQYKIKIGPSLTRAERTTAGQSVAAKLTKRAKQAAAQAEIARVPEGRRGFDVRRLGTTLSLTRQLGLWFL